MIDKLQQYSQGCKQQESGEHLPILPAGPKSKGIRKNEERRNHDIGYESKHIGCLLPGFPMEADISQHILERIIQLNFKHDILTYQKTPRDFRLRAIQNRGTT